MFLDKFKSKQDAVEFFDKIIDARKENIPNIAMVDMVRHLIKPRYYVNEILLKNLQRDLRNGKNVPPELESHHKYLNTLRRKNVRSSNGSNKV